MNTGARIVVIDDTQANLILLANLLQDAGHEVRVANSGGRGLAMIEKQPPDLVLLDVNLPDRDGFEVCADIKANQALRHVPVLFLSAHDDAASRNRGFAAGAAEYLVKPFEAAEILARVEHFLTFSRMQRENVTLRALLRRVADPDPSGRPTSDELSAALNE
jgi:DNA-binding response OmpR family regulator